VAAVSGRIAEGGFTIVGIGPAAAHQARHLRANGIPFPLVLDEGGEVAAALGLRRQSLARFAFNLRAWTRWLGSFIRHRRQYRITGHYSEVPAVAIVRAGGAIDWIHRGRGIGDYPPVSEVLRRLERNTNEGDEVEVAMSQPSGPNPAAVAWSALRASRLSRPAPIGSGTVDHGELSAVLDALRRGGVGALVPRRVELKAYRDRLGEVDPDSLSRAEALAFWLNLYNAGALDLAAEGFGAATDSVLRIPGGFTRLWADVAGEALSLDGIEHGKIRRFSDPRFHSALVCGSASCPTLRYEPFTGDRLEAQLDDQMRSFLSSGAAIADDSTNTLRLSRIFLWYGADFVRPHRMPAWIPAGKRAVVRSLLPWLGGDVRRWVETTRPSIEFQPYDWSLACAVGFSDATQPEDH
jgi:hypothetical protein